MTQVYSFQSAVATSDRANKILCCFLLIFLGKNLDAFSSLLLQEEEIERIQENLPEEGVQTLNTSPTSLRKLTLYGIMYLDKDHWTVWVNDKTLSSKSPRNIGEFCLKNLTPTNAEFSWTPPDSTTSQIFTLLPFQTYLLDQQKVVDEIEN